AALDDFLDLVLTGARTAALGHFLKGVLGADELDALVADHLDGIVVAVIVVMIVGGGRLGIIAAIAGGRSRHRLAGLRLGGDGRRVRLATRLLATRFLGRIVGVGRMRFGFGVLALLGLDQRLPVGDRDLVIIGVDFGEGEETVPVTAVIDEGR